MAIQPANYAFSIWGFIYGLLGIFVVYQALPSEWVPSRNNKLIFEDIGYLFFANMMIIPVWFVAFQQNTNWGFLLSLFIIMAMLATNTILWVKSFSQTVNWWEWVSMRVGFSMYSGWVTAATVLNGFLMLKSFGAETLGGAVTEEQLAIYVLWAVFAIYGLGTFIGNNPTYGSILIWVVLAIKEN